MNVVESYTVFYSNSTSIPVVILRRFIQRFAYHKTAVRRCAFFVFPADLVLQVDEQLHNIAEPLTLHGERRKRMKSIAQRNSQTK